MKLNFGHAASAVAVAALMIGNAVADQYPTNTNDANMPGNYYNGTGTVVQPGANPGAVNPPPPAPQNPGYPTPSTGDVVPQDGMMGSPPPGPMPGEVMMGPDGLDSSTTTTAPPPGKSMAPPAGPMGPQNSPAPGPQSKVKTKGKQVVSKR